VLRGEILKPGLGVNVEALQRVALAVAQERHLGTVLRLIVKRIAEEPDVALMRLWLLGAEPLGLPSPASAARPQPTRWLQLAASAGRPLASEEDWSRLNGAFSRFALGAEKVGVIGQSGDSVLIPDLSVGQPWVRRPDWVRREALQSFAGHPLKFRDEVLGVLGLFSRARLTESDFRWLRAFADQAAVALANARSFEALERLRAQLERENEYLQTELKEAFAFGEIVGVSPALQKALSQIQLVAPTAATVLITGESGTGKELVARAVHERSARRQRPFIKVNCAAIPEHLL
jgi:transcriptional regulator with GAF, ATPase, and Fis domain